MNCIRSFLITSNPLFSIIGNKKVFLSVKNHSTSSFLCKLDNSLINIFDRKTKRLQRKRAAAAEDVNVYDYLKDEIGFRLADRVFDIKRKFVVAADIGKRISNYLTLIILICFYRMQSWLCF